MNTTHEARKKLNLCIECGKVPPFAGIQRCSACSENRHRSDAASKETRAAERLALIEKKICPRCKEKPAREGAQLCDTCTGVAAERSRAWRERKLSTGDGRCFYCSDPVHEKSISCLYHFVQKLVYNFGGNKAETESLTRAMIVKLETQERLCFFTKVPLVVGVNASIDHLFSRKRFPDRIRDVDNLVWADDVVNFSKRELTPTELVTMAEAILLNKDKILAAK